MSLRPSLYSGLVAVLALGWVAADAPQFPIAASSGAAQVPSPVTGGDPVASGPPTRAERAQAPHQRPPSQRPPSQRPVPVALVPQAQASERRPVLVSMPQPPQVQRHHPPLDAPHGLAVPVRTAAGSISAGPNAANRLAPTPVTDRVADFDVLAAPASAAPQAPSGASPLSDHHPGVLALGALLAAGLLAWRRRTP